MTRKVERAQPIISVALDAKRITIKDGDKVDEWRVDRVRRASAAYGRQWSIVFADASMLLSRVPVKGATSIVLWWSMGQLHPRDWLLVSHTQLSGWLGVDRSSISRAFKDLVERGIVRKSSAGYRLSLWLSWQGTAAAYQKERRKRQAEIDYAQAWHEDRAVAYVDGGSPMYWRFHDERGTVQEAQRVDAGDRGVIEDYAFVKREGPTAADEWMVMRQPQYTMDEWQAIGRDQGIVFG